MVDFSHYSVITPDMVVYECERGRTPTDEMLLEALDSMSPPLLPEMELKRIIEVLSGKRGPAGAGAPSREELANRILATRRNSVHPVFLQALADRLRKPKGLKSAEKSLRFYKQRQRRQRDDIMRGLYRDFCNLDLNAEFVDHPILGEFKVPEKLTVRSERALTLTHEALDDRLGFDVPAIGRMHNIVSGNSARRT